MEPPYDMHEPATAQPTAPESSGKTVKQEAKREVIEFVKMVAWFLVLFVVLRSFVIESCDVQGQSMHPTLESNERILVFKLPHIISSHWPFGERNAIHPGDIVVFRSPDNRSVRYVKRVIAEAPPTGASSSVKAKEDGGPPDSVHVSIADGAVYVNNQKVKEDYLVRDDGTGKAGRALNVTLKPGDYFVMGDNRSDSRDSRSFGPIQDDAIIGKVVLRFWPLSKFGLL